MISRRRRDSELMDQPGLDPGAHVAALRGLRRINALTRSAAILWPAIARAAHELHPVTLRILDLACGGGDNAVAVGRIARCRGVALEVHGCDISPVAIGEAQRLSASQNFDPNSFFIGDVLQQPFPAGFHVVMCSLFLHHLDRQQAVGLMRRMAAAAEHLVLISDLRRTWLGLGLAWVGSRLLTRSPVVRTDAVRSVAAAFAESEIESMAAQSGCRDCVITRHWPQRWLLQSRTS